MLNKKACREFFLEKRQHWNAKKRHAAAVLACDVLVQSDFFQQNDLISSYLSVNDEFNCNPIIEAIWQAGKKCYLPAIDPSSGEKLIILPYSSETVLKPNRYGILEPATGQPFPAEHLQLVLMPLLAFDDAGRRLGMGGGYYDRTFAFMQRIAQPVCHLIGVGFSDQQAACLPEDPWDIRLEAVLTEKGLMGVCPQEGS